MFNEDLLTKYKALQFKEQYMDLASPPTIINEEKKYKVKEVWKHRKWEKGTQYLVHWKDYGDKHNQWIAETGLPHTKEAIKDY